MILFKFLLVGYIFGIGSVLANPLSNVLDYKIVGGFVTTIEQNPWQIALLDGFGSQVCGGSLISEKWILSAAHCFGTSVRVGSSYHAKDGQVVRINRYIRHPKYTIPPKGPFDYDFALLELDEPLNFTDKIKAIALPDADTNIEDGTLTLVSGWGSTQNPSESNNQLRSVYIPIANQDYCKEAYLPVGGDFQVTDRMICAGFDDGTKSPCYGDSGGPLSENGTSTPRLIGVVSWGKGCGAPFFPGVFSRVTSVRSWIKEVTGI